MSSSVILNMIHSVYKTINGYYEHSMTGRLTAWIAKKSAHSFFGRAITGSVTNTRDYGEGSLAIRAVTRTGNAAGSWLVKCWDMLGKLNQGGISHTLYRFIVWIAEFVNNGMIVACGLAASFLGIVLSLTFMPIMAIPSALAFAFLTFAQPSLSFGTFLAAMAIVPHDYWNNIMIMLTALLYLFVYVTQAAAGRRKAINFKELKPSLIVYIAFLLLSLVIGQGGGDSIRVFAILFSCILLSITLQNIITDRKTLYMLLTFLVLGCFLTSLFGLYQYKTGIEVRADLVDLISSQGLKRLFSTMGNPNNYAEYLVMIIPIGFACMLNSKNDLKKLIIFLVCMVCIYTLVLTGSRGAYLAAVAAAGVFIALSNPRLVPLGIVVFLLCIPILPDTIVRRVLTIGKDTSSQYRLLIWESTLRTLKDFWIQGVGLGPVAFSRIYKIYATDAAAPAMHSHNLFLQVLIETGIGGFISFAALLLGLIKQSITAIIRFKNTEYRYLFAAYAASFTAIIVMGMVEYVWFYPRVMLMFWLLVGLSMGTFTLCRKSEAGELK